MRTITSLVLALVMSTGVVVNATVESPCPHCGKVHRAVPGQTNLQAEAQVEAQSRAARGFKGHVRGSGMRCCDCVVLTDSGASVGLARRSQQLAVTSWLAHGLAASYTVISTASLLEPQSS